MNITKAQAYKEYTKNPEMAGFRMLWSMMEDCKKQLNEAVEKANERALKDIVNHPQFLLAVQHVKQGEKGEKGETGMSGRHGFTPTKGKDYFTEREIKQVVAHIQSLVVVPQNGINGKDGYTPKAGVDFPTEKQLTKMIGDEFRKLLSMKPESKEVSAEEVAKLVGTMQERVDFKARAAEIARALETLQGGARLDYDALKNKPGVKMYEEGKGRIIARGGPPITILPATGTIDDSNLAFAFTHKPTWITINGASYRENDHWTWTSATLTATLDFAVGTGGSIYGVK